MSGASGNGVEYGSEAGPELLEIAIEAAFSAGGMLLERFEHDRVEGVSSKSTPTDLVSEADLASERAIRELLAERRPKDGFVGEEGDDHEGESELRWIVDPLDGTVNFLFGIPHWCVSVAVGDRKQMLAGAIYDPLRGEMFSVRLGERPTISSGKAPVELMASTRGDLATAMVATGLAYDAEVRASQGEVLGRLVPLVRDIRRFGSAALDLAWTAAGRYDAYFERGVKQWDIAAGVLICEAAGLVSRELAEAPALPYGILVSNQTLIEPLFELVGG